MTDYTWHESRPVIKDHPHFSREEGERVVRFAAWILTCLRMANWRVDLSPEPSDEDAIAEVNCVEGRHVATVALASDWKDRPDEERMNAVIHEMMHVVHYRLTHHMYSHLEKGGFVPDATREIMWEGTRIEAEFMADHLAGAFSQWVAVRQQWSDTMDAVKKEFKAAKKSLKTKGS